MKLARENEVQCSWCETIYRETQLTNCNNCGGPLPAPPGADAGPKPPPTPRQLPEGYRNRILYWKNVEVMIGMIFTLVFFWAIIFPIIGIWLWMRGKKRAEGKLMALEMGQAAEAQILDVYRDHSTKINGRSPWIVEYEFQTPHGAHVGQVQAWNPVNGRRHAGEPLWVVYMPHDPELNAIWPPIR